MFIRRVHVFMGVCMCTRLCFAFDFMPAVFIVCSISEESLEILPVIHSIDELQNPLPRETMLLEGHMNSTGGRSDAFGNV